MNRGEPLWEERIQPDFRVYRDDTAGSVFVYEGASPEVEQAHRHYQGQVIDWLRGYSGTSATFMDISIGRENLRRAIEIVQELTGSQGFETAMCLVPSHDETQKLLDNYFGGYERLQNTQACYAGFFDTVYIRSFRNMRKTDWLSVVAHEVAHRSHFTVIDFANNPSSTMSSESLKYSYSAIGTMYFTGPNFNGPYGAVEAEAYAQKYGKTAMRKVIDNQDHKPGTCDYINPPDDGFNYEDLVVDAFDLINEAAGLGDELGIYRYIGEYGRSGLDPNAREALDDVVSTATGQTLSLYDIETHPDPISAAGSLSLLERVEEACGARVMRRLSSTWRPLIAKMLAHAGPS